MTNVLRAASIRILVAILVLVTLGIPVASPAHASVNVSIHLVTGTSPVPDADARLVVVEFDGSGAVVSSTRPDGGGNATYTVTTEPAAGHSLVAYAVDSAHTLASAPQAIDVSASTMDVALISTDVVTGTVVASDGTTQLTDAEVIVRDGSGAVKFVSLTEADGSFLAYAPEIASGWTVTVAPPQDDSAHGNARSYPYASPGTYALDGRDFFGRVIGKGSVTDGNYTPGGPVAGSSLDIYEVSATDVRTLIASSHDGSVTHIDVAGLGTGVFGTAIAFDDAHTYELDVTPTDLDANAATTFRIPGPVGSADAPMSFRLNDPDGEGLLFRIDKWACRGDADTNCVDGLATRAKGSNDAWVPVTLPTTHDYTNTQGSLRSDGSYDWGNYELYRPSGTVSPMRVQYAFRPMNDFNPNPTEDPYPYVIIEMFGLNGVSRDGWGCDGSANWVGPGDGSGRGANCGGGTPLDPGLDYQVSLRTDAQTFQPLFVSGYLAGMKATETGSVNSGSFEMSVAGAARDWQWQGGDNRTFNDVDYSDYYDATNRDWSFSAYDARTVAQVAPSVTGCVGQGVAATSTNGNGAFMPMWDADAQTLTFNTDGKHYAPDGISSINPGTGQAYQFGDAYIGQAEITIPTPLATCMWAMSQSDLSSLAGDVLDVNGDAKAGAQVTVAVDGDYVSVAASGYTYSKADLVVMPRSSEPSTPPSGDTGGLPVTEAPTSPTTPVTSGQPTGSTPTIPSASLTPETTTPMASGLWLLGKEDAARAVPRGVHSAPSLSFAEAPRVVATTGRPLALVVPGMQPGSTQAVRVKVQGRYITLGSAEVDATGHLILPVFKLSRPGVYRMAITDPSTGESKYVALVVRARR